MALNYNLKYNPYLAGLNGTFDISTLLSYVQYSELPNKVKDYLGIIYKKLV